MNYLLIMMAGAAMLGPKANDPKSDVTALSKPVSVLSKPVSAIKGDPRVTDTVPPPVSSAYRQVQDAVDRSLGYIPDDQIYELDRIDQNRAERLGLVDPQREFDRLQDERERRLRLEDRAHMTAQELERARRAELDRREYLRWLSGPSSAVAGQAAADERALDEAKQRRTEATAAAAEEYNVAIKEVTGTPDERAAALRQLEAQYEAKRQQISKDYDAARARIFGIDK